MKFQIINTKKNKKHKLFVKLRCQSFFHNKVSSRKKAFQRCLALLLNSVKKIG